MYIQCTKKLLTKLKKPYEELAYPPPRQYCWHASFIEYMDLFQVVMVNDLGGEEISFEVESFTHFAKQVEEVILLDLEEAEIPTQEISRYMQEAGPITFGPISDRAKSAQIGALTRRMKDTYIGTQDLLDSVALMTRNMFLPPGMSLHEQEFFPDNPIPLFTTEHHESSLHSLAPAIALDVELKLVGGSKVTRSFLVPLTITFADLHKILQIGFGWSDTHLHEFVFNEDEFSVGIVEKDQFGEAPDFLSSRVYDEQIMTLSVWLPGIPSFTYFYDFGDAWEHIIKVGEISKTDDGPIVECTGGQGSVPPEDCKGEYGFAELLAILKDPSHEGYEEVEHWAGYDFAGGFDKDSINEELAGLKLSQVLL